MSRYHRYNRRYRDLKEQIKQRSLHHTPPQPNDALGQALDDVNAWGFLDDQQQAQHRAISCFGPGVFRGYLPVAWVGVAIWHKPRGYYFYDTLGMIGIWALRAEPDAVDIVLGTRTLAYKLPFFNPESYYRRIQQEFRTFYQDNGAPPAPEERRLTVRYDPAQRLDIRRAIEDELILWAAQQNAPAGW